MKSLRRSLNNNNNNNNSPQPSPPLPSANSPHSVTSPLGRPSEKVAPPQKVIKALRSHRSTNPQELSYNQGDFWYVTGERDRWYEALNPLAGSRGLVPKDDFEEFMKGGRTVSQGGSTKRVSEQHQSQQYQQPSRSHTPSLTHGTRSPPITSPPSSNGIPAKQKQPVYAIVQFDFVAERPDELDAKKGEAIVVIAQSNHEWFVAKPIGRLGGPGLIPVSFVEMRDPVTGLAIEISPDTIPMVDEWKQATANYKAAAIPLGRFDIGPDQGVINSPYANPVQSTPPSQTSLPRNESAGSAKPLYRPEQDPSLPPGQFTALAVPSFHNESGNYWFRLQVTFVPDEPNGPAYGLSLYRTYEDFYDFQISLLDTFPHEAGRPRPDEEDLEPPERILPYMPGPVDDEIDDELTEYRREELDLYVKALVDLRSKDAGYIVRHELFRTFFAAKYGDYCEEQARADAMGELEERLADLNTSETEPRQSGSYPAHRAESSQSRHSQPSSYSGGHARQGSSSARGSPLPPLDTSRPPSGQTPHYVSGGPSTGISTTSSFAAPLPATTPNSAGPSGAQPPYVKIKIYDRATDDLIALRVHPHVTHAELFDKVRARLGSEVGALRYRTSMNTPGGGGYGEIRDDNELRNWMRTEDQKLVLYAEQT